MALEPSDIRDRGSIVKPVAGFLLLATVGGLILFAVMLNDRGSVFMDDARWMAQYVAVHKSAAARIPVARQMEEIFGEADHFITHYGSHGEMTWNTLCFVNDRYRFDMTVKVTVDYRHRTVTQVGKPMFSMHYIERTTDGGSTYFGGTEYYTLEQWNKVYAAGGDFEAIGVELETTPAPGVQHYIDFYRRTLIPIDLVP